LDVVGHLHEHGAAKRKSVMKTGLSPFSLQVPKPICAAILTAEEKIRRITRWGKA
jgi:hypothetical protein